MTGLDIDMGASQDIDSESLPVRQWTVHSMRFHIPFGS
jgi:hypothetical protein